MAAEKTYGRATQESGTEPSLTEQPLDRGRVFRHSGLGRQPFFRGERTWTVGPSWYLNHVVRIEAPRDKLTDIERKAVPASMCAGRVLFDRN